MIGWRIKGGVQGGWEWRGEGKRVGMEGRRKAGVREKRMDRGCSSQG